jgi:nitrile hydratase accessory protein
MTDRAAGDWSDLPALPKDEDGPVFAEPWQAQAFAMAVTLSGQGHFTWKEWAAALADELRAAAERGQPDDGSRYYHHWLAALERLATARQLTTLSELRQRKDDWAEAYRSTPHGKPVQLGRDSTGSAGLARSMHYQSVTRADGRVVDLRQRRAHISYCFSGCCCGKTQRGYAPVPSAAFKDEWLRRRLRRVVHLTKAACLGPCDLANVANLIFDGHAVWFHSVNGDEEVRAIFDYVESLLAADRFLPPPPALARLAFNFYDWDSRAVSPSGDASR